MPTERWKPIKEFETRYAISTLGRTKNVQTKHILRPFFASGKRNNLAVSLTNAGIGHSYSLSKLMAETFMDACPEGHRLSFRDGDKNNCKKSNLCWVAPKKNERTFSAAPIVLTATEAIASIWKQLLPDTQALLKKHNLIGDQNQGEYGMKSRYDAEKITHDK